MFTYPVPTSTVIPYVKDQPYLVWCIRHQQTKHAGLPTAPGGRRKLGRVPKQVGEYQGRALWTPRSDLGAQSPEQCACEEFEEECGGGSAVLGPLRLFGVKTDPFSDIRQGPAITLGKLTHGACDPEESGILCVGLYGCPDHIFTAPVTGTPAPKDGEARECFLVDVRSIRVAKGRMKDSFGAQMDLYLWVYAQWLDGQFSDCSEIPASVFSDLDHLRQLASA